METYSAVNFADASVWRSFLLIAVLLLSLLLANILKAVLDSEFCSGRSDSADHLVDLLLYKRRVSV